MKQMNSKILILILGTFFLLGLVGCAKEEAVFISTDALQMEDANVQEPMTVAKEEYTKQVDNAAKEQESVSLQKEELAVESEKEMIIVHVCGAVKNPGVYQLDREARVIDGVEHAGGFIEQADMEYMNLAGKLLDGDKIWIPTKEETAALGNNHLYATSFEKESSESGKVNINTADAELLCTLPGIGESRAAGIIAYREEYGRFATIEDIMNVSGIKDSSFRKIKDYIIVN